MSYFFNVRRLVVAFGLIGGLCAQQRTNEATAVPRLIRFNGSHHIASQQTQTGVLGATFSIYRDQYDGTPLWTEIQNMQLDKDGNYTVLLGSTRSEGIPVNLFTTTEPRWLQVEIDQVKQPRILLGSVPYALKSVDADTLGGLPASAYLRVNPVGASASTNSNTNNLTAVAIPSLSPLASSGTPNCIGVFAADGTDVANSFIDQTTYAGNPAVTVGTPCVTGGAAGLGALTLIGNVPFGDAAGMALYNAGAGAGASVSLDMYNTPFNNGIPQAKIKAIDDGAYSDNLTFWTKNPGAPTNPVTERVRIASGGNVGIGTTTPSAKLEVNGTLKIDGSLTFPDGTSQATASSGGTGGGATVSVGTTTSGAPGTQASVTNSGSSSAAVFNFTIPQGATGPQGLTGPAGSGGVIVLDASGNVLGTLISLAPPQESYMPSGVVVYRNGYFINLEFSGQFPYAFALGSPIVWTNSNCSGNGYLVAIGTGILTSGKFVIYSGQNNALYALSGGGATAVSIQGASSSVEDLSNSGSDQCINNSGTFTGWLLSPFNASAALGWTVSGNPLSVAGPIKFQ